MWCVGRRWCSGSVVLLVGFMIMMMMMLVNGEDFYSKTDVIELNQENFNTVVRDKTVVLVEFYAPWCGHCKALKPDWIRAATMLKGMVKVAAVNADEASNRGLASQFGIRGFPTIKMFVNGRPTDYNGGRDVRSIVTMAKSSLPDHVKRVRTEEDKSKLSFPHALLFTDKPRTSAIFKALALQFKDRVQFGLARNLDSDLVKKYEVQKYPTLLMFTKDGEAPVAFEGKPSSRSLKKFIGGFVQAIPELDEDEPSLVFELSDQSCLIKYCQKQASLCALLVSRSKQRREQEVEVMNGVAAERSDRLFKFVWVDAKEHGDFLKNGFGISEDGDAPEVVAISYKKKRFTKFVGSFQHDNVATFLRHVLSGKEKTSPFVSSVVELPKGTKCNAPTGGGSRGSGSGGGGGGGGRADKSLDGESTVLTAANFDALVLKSGAPWMVEFYAPWCGHCKSLAPHWAAAAKKSRNMVRFGQVDATVEQQLAQRFGIRGYPTIKVFGVGSDKTDSSATDYQGARSADAILRHGMGLLTDKLVTRLDMQSLPNWFGNQPTLPHMLLFSKKSKVPTLYNALAWAHQNQWVLGFVHSSEETLVQQFKVTEFPRIMLLEAPSAQLNTMKNEQGIQASLYGGKLSFKPLSEMMRAAAPSSSSASSSGDASSQGATLEKPTVHLIKSQGDFESACLKRTGLCFVTLLSPDAMQEQVYDDALMALATKYAARPYHFLKADRFLNEKFTQIWGIADDGPVTCVAIIPSKKRFVGFMGVFDEEHVSEFLDAVVKGRLRSAPYPMKELPHFATVTDDEE